MKKSQSLENVLKLVFADVTKEITKNPIVGEPYSNDTIQGTVHGIDIKVVKGVNTDGNKPHYTYNIYSLDGALLYGIPMDLFPCNDDAHKSFALKFQTAQKAIDSKYTSQVAELKNKFANYESDLLDKNY